MGTAVYIERRWTTAEQSVAILRKGKRELHGCLDDATRGQVMAMIRGMAAAGKPVAMMIACLALQGAAHAGQGSRGESAAPSAPPSSAPASKDCAFCACYSRFAHALEKSTREVGALSNGIVVHYHSEDPETVVEIQRFAFERNKLRQAAIADPKSIRLCGECRPKFERLRGANFEVSNSVHGVFTMITSNDLETVRILHEMASEQTKKGVRGS